MKRSADTESGSNNEQPTRKSKITTATDNEPRGEKPPPFEGRKSSRISAQKLWEAAVRKEQHGQLEAAFAAFTKVLILCPCQDSTRDTFQSLQLSPSSIDPVGRCSCKDFVVAAQARRRDQHQRYPSLTCGPFPASELDLDAVYGLATRDCTCGSGRVRCAVRAHVAVADRMATVAAKLGRHDDVLRLAQSIVDLAPHRAEGYLRLAKAVMAMDSTRFVARCIYVHGLHNVRTHGANDGSSSSSNLEHVLAHCSASYARNNYLPHMPVEIVEAVLHHLSLADLMACCRVSKTWASMLQRVRVCPHRVLLEGQIVSGNNRGRGRENSPGLKGLARLFRRLPHLKTTALEMFFDEEYRKIYRQQPTVVGDVTFLQAVALHRFSGIKSLSLDLPLVCKRSLADVLRQEDLLPASQRANVRLLTSCRSLSVYGACSDNVPALLGLLKDAGPTLQSLRIDFTIGKPENSISEIGFTDLHLPQLKSFRASAVRWSPCVGSGAMPAICLAAPGLEQLFLEQVGFHLDVRSNETPGDSLNYDNLIRAQPIIAGYDRNTLLQNLHTLVVRDSHDRTVSDAVFPLLPAATMRCVDLGIMRHSLVTAIMEALLPKDSTGLPCLEAFRCHNELSVPLLTELFSSTSSSPLESLELEAFDLEDDLLRNDDLAVSRPELLRNVGLYNINWDSDPGLPGYVACRSALCWLARFPNLEAVALYPTDRRYSAALLLAFVNTIRSAREEESMNTSDNKFRANTWAKLHTIYDESRSCVTRDQAVGLAKSLGIAVVSTVHPNSYNKGRLPVFPWPVQTGSPGLYGQNWEGWRLSEKERMRGDMRAIAT